MGVLAIVLGLVGIVVAGVLLAVITAITAGVAGQRARERGGPLDNAYIALALAGVDGVVWIALHILFDIPLVVG